MTENQCEHDVKAVHIIYRHATTTVSSTAMVCLNWTVDVTSFSSDINWDGSFLLLRAQHVEQHAICTA